MQPVPSTPKHLRVAPPPESFRHRIGAVEPVPAHRADGMQLRPDSSPEIQIRSGLAFSGADLDEHWLHRQGAPKYIQMRETQVPSLPEHSD